MSVEPVDIRPNVRAYPVRVESSGVWSLVTHWTTSQVQEVLDAMARDRHPRSIQIDLERRPYDQAI